MKHAGTSEQKQKNLKILLLPLSKGRHAIVDPDDYDRLSRNRWYVSKGRNTCYAIRGQWSPEKKRRLTISMHREVVDIPDGMYVDHINHNGLDNRKANLRPAKPDQNARHTLYPKRNTSSKYRGVWYNKKKRRWRAVIGINNTRKTIGNYREEIDAAKAYDEEARKHYGEFAVLNFPESRMSA